MSQQAALEEQWNRFKAQAQRTEDNMRTAFEAKEDQALRQQALTMEPTMPSQDIQTAAERLSELRLQAEKVNWESQHATEMASLKEQYAHERKAMNIAHQEALIKQ